ncbi:MAG: PD-(D/E)XK nuclease family protein [Bacteroidales bacterium]|jgi:hypothetical protein|nr:PD-(D/E)XK nuclease family protein [Bacteroidales bacterium]MCB5246364.1 PD-(D/E)XK nuclease family protein [Candidatus Cloacimonadota bacterium]HOJ23707.1 PD-(D/E)XK nuclease family protein [Bacteroidales bacterium]HOV55164.1 PD-(D/E)XK nuclease family protein [Bacteroidales bacterium]
MEIREFFNIIDSKITIIKQVRQYYGKELASNFNSFDFWDLDENKVSNIIAFFLNPNEKHEQADVYLKHFLKKFKLEFFKFDRNNDIEVKCEKNIDNNRRIDIFISNKLTKQVIAIENKIYTNTEDQNNQINDYINFLIKTTNNNYCLIYLCPRGKEISTNSISKEDRERYSNDNNLRILTYEEDMIDCIKEFADLTQNYRVKSFLKDFEKKLRRMYMGEEDINIQNEIINFIKENDKNLGISFLIYNSMPEIKKQLQREFEMKLKEIANLMELREYSERALSFKPSQWTKHTITFSYEQGGIIYGIKRLEADKNKTKLPEIEEYLKNEIQETFNTSEWWPLWQLFYKNIKIETQFWLDIVNGNALTRAKKFIELINDKFNTADY